MEPISRARVPTQGMDGGRGHGNQSRLAELGPSDLERLLPEVDIVAIEADDLADAHPRDRQQSKRGRVGLSSKTCGRWQPVGGLDQVLNGLVKLR